MTSSFRNHYGKTAALFLDRDGTILEEVGFLKDAKDMRFIAGSIEALRRINREGWKVVVISNQSGVARGYYTEEDVRRVHQAFLEKLNQENVRIDGFYYCPHHPEGNAPYNIRCECRKPAAGMVYRAARELSINISRSAVIGDKAADVHTGLKLNIPGVLVLTGYGASQRVFIEENRLPPPTFIAENLSDAVTRWFTDR